MDIREILTGDEIRVSPRDCYSDEHAVFGLSVVLAVIVAAVHGNVILERYRWASIELIEPAISP